jgi:adenylate kinase
MILLLGPPGAGKSVQGGLLAAEMGYVSISTGVILRNRADDALKETMLKGDLVSDEVVQDLVAKELGTHTPLGALILDGFPRNAAQAKWLIDDCLAKKINIECIIHITVDIEVCLRRLIERGRPDDRADIVAGRYNDYKSVAGPIVEQMVQASIPVLTVDGTQNIELVRSLIFAQLDQRRKTIS